jgi:hypothetical protein
MSPTTLTHELHELLAEEPSELAFRAVCALLDTWPGDATDALRRAGAALASWPDGFRLAPWSWCRPAARGERKPTWQLVRAVQVCSAHLGCEPVLLREVGAECAGGQVACLHLHRFAHLDDDDGAAVLAGQPDRWPGLRQVSGLDCTDESLESFLASDLLPRLRDVELFLPTGPRSAKAVPGFTRTAADLRELRVAFTHDKDVRALLADEYLPRLTGLSLRGGWFTEAVPEHFWQLAGLPLFARLERLLLAEFPQEVLLFLLTRSDLNLQRLEIVTRGYLPNRDERQEFACRLDRDGVRSLARAPTLATLTYLSVQNERVGDDVLGLLDAIPPGTLQTLELVNVGLTDAGIARLARMPQLSALTAINLRENAFTDTGLAALLRSPHLGRLRRLRLGGQVAYSGYYADHNVQAVGDSGAEALASSGLLAALDELTLCSAAVGPRGAAALAAVEAPRLVRLDLSGNPIGPGAAALATARLLPALRELDLSVCGLDDDAIRHLAEAPFRHLRVLELAYNSVGPDGARYLAAAAALCGLWRLNLHDNFIGDEGLIALAGSPYLGRLVELDLEQDVWNYRVAPFGDEAARAVARSLTFARLDALFAVEVDEYTGSRVRPAFSRAGLDALRSSARLRPEARQTIDPDEDDGQRGPAQEAGAGQGGFFLHYTPREIDTNRRAADFRGLPPPDLSMDERQWQEAVDPDWMLAFLGDRVSDRQLRLFACACARRVGALHPDDRLARLIELGERWADGQVDPQECTAALLVAQAAHPYEPTEQTRMSVAGASYAPLRQSAREAAEVASSQAVDATIADTRRRGGRVASVSYTPEHAAQAGLVRCVFGNPHHPVPADPLWLSWNEGTVPAIARAIYEERAFDRLPILADALEEAGCADAEVLTHCRGNAGEHCRGCWVVDLLRGAG